MPKEKKKGLFSLFRKKAPKEQPTAAQAVIPPDSFADINDLIPTPEIVYQKPKEVPPAAVVSAEAKEVVPADPKAPETKVDKARKKARAAPPPPQERGVDVGGFEPTAAAVPKKPPRDLNNLSVEEKKAIIRKQLSEDQEQEKMSSRKSSASSGSRVVETNVLHYSPQTQHRPYTSSPTPVSEAPPVERQSNIILNGTARVKSIPVTQYDGRPKQAAPPPPPPIGSLPIYREKVVPAAAPPPTMSVEVASPPAAAYHKKQSSLDSTMTSRTPKLDAPPKAVHRSPLATVVEPPKVSKEEQDLQRRYENIKSKFDLWQVLKDDERHTKEAKKLQMELIRDHDSLMELVKRSNGEQDVPPSPGQIQKKRPSIAPDTYTPRLPLTNTVRSPLTITASYSSNSIGSSSPNSSTPGTSRSATPKNTAPSPSVSPAASVDSSDSGVVRGGERSEYAAPRIEIKRPQAVDENANLLKRISKPRDSIELQKQNAINRINDEVKEQRRKEHELKRFSQPAMIINLEELEAQPTSNGQLTNGTASPREGQLKPKLPAKEAEPPKRMASSPVVKQSAGISRVMVNTSPAPSPVQKPTAVKEYPVVQGKTVVSVNKAPEKIYAAPKVSPVSRPMDSPKTPPLPSTPHPKLSHFNRTVSADEAPVIYKVPSKSNGYVVPEKNNNVTKLSPVKETKQPRSPTTQKKRTEKTHKVTTKDVKPSPVLNEPKPGVTSAIKNTIATSRVEVEVKPAVKEPVERGTVSRNIADTLAKHNSPSRPALDLSAMIGQSALRKVAQPIERNGIALGRVVDPSPAAISAPVVTYIPPPPPPPLPPMMAAVPPPPPPPPSDLLSSSIYQVPSPIDRPSSISMAAPPAPPPPPPLVTTSQLNDQKQRLRTPVFAAKSASPLDLRDSLMAEIRNAGGGRGLRKANRN